MENKSQNPEISKIRHYFNFYIENVYPLVVQRCTQKMCGMHGLDTHTAAVVFRGIDYALSMKYDPVPVIFACAFHDMARTNDSFDMQHGKNAVPMAISIMNQFKIPQQTQESIIYAITNHTIGIAAPDYISACLWDADRTRLSWLYGYDAKYFNTMRAKQIASSQYEAYQKFQQKCFPQINWNKEY